MCQNWCGKFSTPMGLVYWPSGQVISDEPHSFALIPFRDPGSSQLGPSYILP